MGPAIIERHPPRGVGAGVFVEPGRKGGREHLPGITGGAPPPPPTLYSGLRGWTGHQADLRPGQGDTMEARELGP